MGLFDFKKSSGDKPSIDLSDMKFISDDHIRYEKGRDVSGHNNDCWRGIRVQNNISGGQGYTVTIYNLDGNHPVWGNNIQMAPKQMRIVEQNTSFIKLNGYGIDAMGGSFADYGITLHLAGGILDKVSLHMYDRNIDIMYFKADSTASPSKPVTSKDIEREFFNGVDAINRQDGHSAVKYFNNTLTLIYNLGITDDELESSCCFNLGEALKYLKRYDEAITYYRKAIEKKKLNEDAYIGLSDCYFLLETIEGLQRVIEILSKCILYFPNNEIAHLNKGVALFKLNRYSEAYSSLQRALQLGSQEARMYLEIVRKYINQ